VGNEDNDPQKAQPGDHVILGVSTKGGDHSRFAGSVQQYARDGVRILAGEQYAVNVDGKDFTRQAVEVDKETGEEREVTVELSATDFRNAIEAGDVETVAQFLPQALRSQAKEIINMMGAQVAMSNPEQAQVAEILQRLVEETMDEISAMAGGAVEGPASKKKKKRADTLIREEDDEESVDEKELKKISDELKNAVKMHQSQADRIDSIVGNKEVNEAISGAITIEDVRMVMDKLGLTGPDWNVIDVFERYAELNNAEELEKVLTKQMTENQADLAWGPANLALDPVEREPHYSEEDEIEPLKKRRAGANVALGE
jgi:dienelactone hydrolase